MLQRRPCWQCQLSKFLFLASHTPFAYGSFDCGLFVSDAIESMTGTDLAASFRNKYRSRAELLPLIRDYAGSPSILALTERIATDYQMHEIPILRAQRGDLAVIRRAKDYSLGLIDLSGRQIVIALARGIGRVPISRAFRTWKVG